MMTFFCTLIAPRASFAQDMNADEAKVMQQHAVYWRGQMEQGKVVTFGLVLDPAGAYGIGVIEVETEAEAGTLTSNDPAILSGRGFRYDIQPMPMGAVHR